MCSISARSILLLFAAVISVGSCSSWPALDKIKSDVDSDIQEIAVRGLIRRLLGYETLQRFSITVNESFVANHGKEQFSLLTTSDGTLSIKGTSGVAAATGLGYYLKYHCKSDFSWSGDQLNLPEKLPVITVPITIPFNDRFRYYQNVCTVSYSSVWWDFARWEREIDWMALSGINLPLAFTGQEEIFRRVYIGMGFTQQDMDELFAGPAFLAWGRMANIDGWGGPLPEDWYQQQFQLQSAILERMREFGMTPVLPAFSGHVPRSFQTRFPDAAVARLGDWNGFNDTYCCTYLLDPNDERFKVIGNAFIKEQTKAFGTNHVYNCDVFNEMTPKSNVTQYLASVGRAVYKGMAGADPDAVWLMQGWLFKSSFWQVPQANALLTSVPIGSMIVLDLQAEIDPQYVRLESFFGQPFIWCMLHNFGGNLGMYGAVENVNAGPFKARLFPNSTIIGTGITMEGINQNDVMYEFMNEMAWRDAETDLDDWVDMYATRRYGINNPFIQTAWEILFYSVYNCTYGSSTIGHKILIKRPSLQSKEILCYKPEYLLDAWDLFIQEADALTDSSTFRYDLVDVTREVLQDLLSETYANLTATFKAGNVKAVRHYSQNLLNMLTDMEKILASDEHYLLGRWIESARNATFYENEKDFFEWNARNQITLWGPTGEILDYAGKQWSGMVADYYLPRWHLFTETLINDILNGSSFHQAAFDANVFDAVENPFTYSKKRYPVEPVGDTVDIAKAIYQTWRNLTSVFGHSKKSRELLLNFGDDADLIQNLYESLIHTFGEEGKRRLFDAICRSHVCLDDIHKAGQQFYLLESEFGISRCDSHALTIWKEVTKSAMDGELSRCMRDTCGWKIIT